MRGFEIDQFDALFAARTTEKDWAHIKAFRDRPQFPAAAAAYLDISAPFFANNFILNKVVPEAWRFQMIVFLLHLYDTRDPDNPRSGLTLSNFQRVCARLDLASKGRAFAFLNLMRVGGYVMRMQPPQGNRVVHLEPTPLFLATVTQWNDGIFRMIDIAAPETSLIDHQRAYPHLGREMRRNSTERILSGWQPLGPFPEVFHFAATDGGWMLIAYLVCEATRNGDIAPISIDLAKFGRQYGGSRSQLRRLLDGAYRDGLLETPPASGAHVMLTPRLVCAFLTWLASYLAGYQRSALAALETAD